MKNNIIAKYQQTALFTPHDPELEIDYFAHESLSKIKTHWIVISEEDKSEISDTLKFDSTEEKTTKIHFIYHKYLHLFNQSGIENALKYINPEDYNKYKSVETNQALRDSLIYILQLGPKLFVYVIAILTLSGIVTALGYPFYSLYSQSFDGKILIDKNDKDTSNGSFQLTNNIDNILGVTMNNQVTISVNSNENFESVIVGVKFKEASEMSLLEFKKSDFDDYGVEFLTIDLTNKIRRYSPEFVTIEKVNR